MTPDTGKQLLDNLCGLLAKQIELAQQGNVSGVEGLTEQANSIVERIAQSRVLELAEFKNRRQQLEQLYKSLHFVLAAQKADTTEKLGRVRKGRKLLGAYVGSLNNKA